MGNPSRIIVRSTDETNMVYDREGIIFWIWTRTGDFQDQVFQIAVFEPVW